MITSQNPDLKFLGAVLEHPRARMMMLARHDLREAYAQVERKGARFEGALLGAQQQVESALGQIAGYDAEDSTLLEVAKELRDSSSQLYDSMASKAKKPIATEKSKGKK